MVEVEFGLGRVTGGGHPGRPMWEAQVEEDALHGGGKGDEREDPHLAAAGERVVGIRIPSLVFHSGDDRLQLFENARYAEATIPDARLIRFDTGGHLVIITEQATVREAVRRHILDLARAP